MEKKYYDIMQRHVVKVLQVGGVQVEAHHVNDPQSSADSEGIKQEVYIMSYDNTRYYPQHYVYCCEFLGDKPARSYHKHAYKNIKLAEKYIHTTSSFSLY